MRHQRLRLTTTIEFPAGFKDDYSVVLMAFKQAALAAMRAEHHRLFGPCDWPCEVNVVSHWEKIEEAS